MSEPSHFTDTETEGREKKAFAQYIFMEPAHGLVFQAIIAHRQCFAHSVEDLCMFWFPLL